MTRLEWLEGPGGRSVDELIACASRYRVDSIVLAFEQAIGERVGRVGLAALSESERTVLAIESLEREVNNGGYHQFFLNAPEHAPSVVQALERIGCPVTAAISAEALSLLGVKAPVTENAVRAAIERDPKGGLVAMLVDRCDGRYHDSGEPIADRLFEYIRANRASIRID